jgi:hypothetical protein
MLMLNPRLLDSSIASALNQPGRRTSVAGKKNVGSVRLTSPSEQKFIVALKDVYDDWNLFVTLFVRHRNHYSFRQTAVLAQAMRWNRNTAHAVANQISMFGIMTRVEWVSDDCMDREVA